MVVVLVVVVAVHCQQSPNPPEILLLFVHVNCFCRAVEAIENFNKKKMGTGIRTCALSCFFNEVLSFKKHIVAQFDCCVWFFSFPFIVKG